MSKKWVLLGLAVLWVVSCGSPVNHIEAPDKSLGVGLEQGYLAPNFILAEYRSQPIELKAALEGKSLVLLNFWATWCGPCRYELPQLDRLQKEYGDKGFQVLAINVDSNQKALDLYLEDNSFSFPVLYDVSHEIDRRYAINGLPANFILDREGRIIDVIRGYTPLLEPMLKRLIEEARTEPSIPDQTSALR